MGTVIQVVWHGDRSLLGSDILGEHETEGLIRPKVATPTQPRSLEGLIGGGQRLTEWFSWRRRHLLRGPGHPRRSIQGLRVSLPLNDEAVSLTWSSIVEFSNPEDAKKAKEELADKTLLGRPVFIREVSWPRSSTHRHKHKLMRIGPRGDC